MTSAYPFQERGDAIRAACIKAHKPVSMFVLPLIISGLGLLKVAGTRLMPEHVAQRDSGSHIITVRFPATFYIGSHALVTATP